MAITTRINLGAGDKYWPGFTNIDCVGDQDIISDVTSLPMIESESIAEIHAIHVFEHLPRLQVLDILKEWRRILMPEGLLVMEMPSMDKIAQFIVNGANNPRLTMLGIFGDPREENIKMLHQWCYTRQELEAILVKSGFEVEFENPKFHVPKRDLRVVCRRIK